MSKTPEQIIKIIDIEEARLRKLDLPITMGINSTKGLFEVNLNLNNREGLQRFLLDFFYWNNLFAYESSEFKKGIMAEGKYLVNTRQQKQFVSDVPYNCPTGARRSVGDLFRLAVKYYDKDVTLLETMKEMYKIVQEDITYNCKSNSNYGTIYMQVCSTILRRVFCGQMGGRAGYKFDSDNQYHTQTSNLNNEFSIYGTDYTLLFSTSEGKALVENRITPQFKMDPKDLDRLVMAKIAKLRSIRSVMV